MTTTYESVLQLVKRVPSAASADHRDVNWLTDARVVGVARDHNGQIEVFLAGVRLSAASPTVAAALQFRTWHRDSVPPFDANRLLLPLLGHFDQVAAFICTELLRSGADAFLPRAFAQTEPIIELAINRLDLSYQAILGLAGEILLLDALCRQAVDEQVAPVVRSWDGWKNSSRDFSWGTTGVEVKTTTMSTSSHLISGIHQVDRSDGFDGRTPEERLFLVSVGLQPAMAEGNTFTIPQLVDRVINRIERARCGESVVEMFLAHVAEYGASWGGGYEHGRVAPDSAYAMPFLTAFFRAYDMADTAIDVLRRPDIMTRQHIDANSVRFRVELPTIASLGNPVVGANQVARVILSFDA